LRRTTVAALVALLLVALVPVAPVAAGSTAKVVIVVGPVGSHNAHYKSDAEEIATEARRWTPNVVKITTPNATWSKVKAAMQGASVFVYLGHGNGWPSPYPPFQTVTKDGLGLDPSTGADGTKTVYYGEDSLRNDIRLAPNAVVLLYHLCYASGNTEPGLAVGTFADSRQRVDNYGAGFIGAGARAVVAEGHPAHPVVNGIRQLFSTNRTMDQVFRAAPTWHGNLRGPYASQRTPGLSYQLDPDTAAPSGFYRSVIGDLSLTASTVTGTPPAPTDRSPATFVVPGSAEVVSADGTGLFASAEDAADPAATPGSTIADRTHLRLTAEAEPAADGTRIFAATLIGTSTKGYVRSTKLVPRDSAPVAVWTLDTSSGTLSPNGDGTSDALVVAVRFSESVPASLVVKNGGGTTVKSISLTGNLLRFAWDLTTSAGPDVPDGSYTWTLKGGPDAWGNAGVTKSGSFVVDDTPPVSKAAVTGTAGGSGWLVSPAAVALSAIDGLSGVRSIMWRLDDGSATAYAPPLSVTAHGTHTFEYRAIDKAGVKEAWRSLTLKVDTKGPAITVPLTGTAGAVAGTWRSAVSVAPTVKDPASGVASKSIKVDGGDGVALGADPVVVDGDGSHSVKVSAKDVAGNASSATVTFVIDTTAPVVELPEPPATPPTVTPNGDTTGELVRLPFAVSEPGTLTLKVSNAAAKVVRTITVPVAAGAGSIAWDGRTAAGAAVPDGRYTAALAATDTAGNPGAAVKAEVDVFAALRGLARSPSLFYPQDADTLARTTKVTWTLQSPASVSIRVLDAKGAVVRTAMTAKAFAAGTQAWSWAGKTDAGSWAARGTYRIVVTATNGSQAASQWTTVLADAFRVAVSTPTATRGKAVTVTATSAETLGGTPKVVVRQPGLADWSVAMTKAGAAWTATVTPKKAGTAGTMTLVVRATDSAGGTNRTTVKLALQ
jgi:flagellar hook assembly protein FlgD